MLKQRIITAIVLLVVLLTALFYPSPWVFPVFMAVFVGAAAWEWARLSGVDGLGAWSYGLLVFLGCILLIFWTDNQPSDSLWLAASATWVLLWLACAVYLLRTGVSVWQRIPRSVRMLAGIFTLWMAWISAVYLHSQHGWLYLLSVLAIAWVADIGAYFVGRACGQRKLAPQISPGKSWEGAIGGMCSVLITVFVAAYIFQGANNFYSDTLQRSGWFVLFLLAFCMTVVSVLGDLVESLMKRGMGVKDSSALLPGHGGVLDRVDSLLPLLPMALAATLWIHR